MFLHSFIIILSIFCVFGIVGYIFFEYMINHEENKHE